MTNRCSACLKSVATETSTGRALCADCAREAREPWRVFISPAGMVAVAVMVAPLFSGAVTRAGGRDWVALLGGVLWVPAVLALLATGRASVHLRAALAGLVALGGLGHLARGLGLTQPGAVQVVAFMPECTDDHAASCRKRCEQGDAVACDTLGVALDNGKGGLDNDSVGALLAFEKACAGGQPNGCFNAWLVARSDRVPKDETQGFSFAERGCALGHAGACNAEGVALDNGEGVEADPDRAYLALTKACQAELPEGCNNQAILVNNGRGTAQDEALALSLFEHACELGNTHGCNNAAVGYQQGRGHEVDEPKARELYEKACEGELAEACTNVGLMVQAEKDDESPADWFDRACDGGSARGCDELGVMYAQGDRVSTDDAKAAGLFRQACEGKSVNGCVNLGIAYRDALGVEADPPHAVELFSKACDEEDERGCAMLGLSLADTEPRRAQPLLQAACTAGYDDDCEALKRLKRPSKPQKKR